MFVAAMTALYQARGMKYIDSKAKSTMPETLMLKRERKSLDMCHYGHIEDVCNMYGRHNA